MKMLCRCEGVFKYLFIIH